MVTKGGRWRAMRRSKFSPIRPCRWTVQQAPAHELSGTCQASASGHEARLRQSLRNHRRPSLQTSSSPLQGKARQGKARQGKARQGKERKGKERKGKERKGKERKGKETQAVARDRDSQSAWRCIRVDAKEAARMQMLDMWTSMHRTDIKCLFVYYISQNGHNQPVGNVTSCSK